MSSTRRTVFVVVAIVAIIASFLWKLNNYNECIADAQPRYICDAIFFSR